MEIYWYLTAPDGPQPWNAAGSYNIDYDWFQRVARGIDRLGFHGALLATGAHDPWIIAASLISATERMKFLIAIQPGLISPTLLAKMAVTFNQFSKGRVLLNVVSGDKNTLGAYGMHLEHDQRYALSDEFLTVLKPLLAGKSVDLHGDHLDIDIAARRALAAGSDSVGHARMSALHNDARPDDPRELEIYPGLWAGIGLVRPGPGTAIVGSPQTVERTLKAYQQAGVEVFILSGFPLLEEAERFSERVLPRLQLDDNAVTAAADEAGNTFTWSNLWDRPISQTEER